MAFQLPELNVPGSNPKPADTQAQPEQKAALTLPDLKLPDLKLPDAEPSWSDIGTALVDRIVPSYQRMGEAVVQLPSVQAADTQNGVIAQRLRSAADASRQGVESATQLLASVGITPDDLPDMSKDSMEQYQAKSQKLYAAIDKYKQNEILANDPTYTASKERMTEASKKVDAAMPQVDPWSAKGLALNVGATAEDMAGSIAAGIATKSPTVGLATMVPTAYGQYYNDGIQQGYTPSEAKNRAGVLAALEPITESVPLGSLLKPGARALTDIGKTAIGEGLQEMFMQVVQNGYDIGLLDKDMTVGQFLNDVAYSGTVGAIFGGTLHGTKSAVESVVGAGRDGDVVPDGSAEASAVPEGEYDAVAAETAGINPAAQTAPADVPAPSVQITPEQYAAYKAQREQGAAPVDALDAMQQQVADQQASSTGDALDGLVNNTLQPRDATSALRYGLEDLQIPAYLRQQPEALQEALQQTGSQSVADMVQQQAEGGQQGLSPLELPNNLLPAPGQTSVIAMPGPIGGESSQLNTYSPTGRVDEQMPVPIPAERAPVEQAAPAAPITLPQLSLPAPGQTSVIALPGEKWGATGPNRPRFNVNERTDEQAPSLRRPDIAPVPDAPEGMAELALPTSFTVGDQFVVPTDAKPLGSLRPGQAYTIEGTFGQSHVLRGEDGVPYVINDGQLTKAKIAKGLPEPDVETGTPATDTVATEPQKPVPMKSRGKKVKNETTATPPVESVATGDETRGLTPERKAALEEKGRKVIGNRISSEMDEILATGRQRAIDNGWQETASNPPVNDAIMTNLTEEERSRLHDLRLQAQQNATTPAEAKARVEARAAERKRTMAERKAAKPAESDANIGRVITSGKDKITIVSKDDDGILYRGVDQDGVKYKYDAKDLDDDVRQSGGTITPPARSDISQIDRNSINDLLSQLDKPKRKLADIKADMAAMRSQNPDNPSLYDPVADTTRSGFRRTLEARLRGEAPPVQKKSVMGRNAAERAIAETEAFEATRQSMRERKLGEVQQKSAIKDLKKRPWIDRVGMDDNTGFMHDLRTYSQSLGPAKNGVLSDELKANGYDTPDKVMDLMGKVRDRVWFGNETMSDVVGDLKKAPNFKKYLNSIVTERDATAAKTKAEQEARQQAEARDEEIKKRSALGEYGGRSYVTMGDIRMDVIGKEGSKYIVRDALYGKDHVRTKDEVKADLADSEVSPDHVGYEAGAYDKARKNKGIAPSVKSEPSSGKGMSVKEVAKVVSDFKAGLKGVQNVDFTVVPKQADLGLPDGTPPMMAFYDPGNVAVVAIAENLTTPEEVQAQLRHEVIVHYGLRARLSKPEYDAVMDSVLAAEGKDKRLTSYFNEVREAYADVYDLSSPDGQRMMAEEVVAAVAGDAGTAQKVGVIRRAIESIRKLLVKAGLLSPQSTYNDVVDLIKANTDFLRNNRVDNDDVRRSIAPMRFQTPDSFAPSLRRDRKISDFKGPADIKADMEHTQAVDEGSITRTVNGMMDQNIRRQWGQQVYQGLVDDLAPIAEMEKAKNDGELRPGRESAYKMATNSRQINSIVAAAMNVGVPMWKDGGIKLDKSKKGLLQILDPIARMPGNQLALWEHWAGAVRAKRLLAEGRENLYDAAMVDRVINYVNSKPELRKAFNQAHKEYQVYKGGLLDFAEQSGIIDPEARKLWDKDDYVPLYRVSDENDRATAPGGKSRSFVNQSSGIKTLTGGTGKVDIINNMIHNANHLIMSSYNNRVGQMIVALADNVGMTEVPANFKPVNINNADIKRALNDMGVATSGMSKAMQDEYTKLFTLTAPAGKNIVSVMFDGKRKYYEVTDAPLMKAINKVGPRTVAAWMEIFRVPKNILTRAVTATIPFVLRNLTRDIVSSHVQAPKETGRTGLGTVLADSFTLRPLIKAMKGAGNAYLNSPNVEAYRAAGGFSGGYDGARPDQLAKQLRAMSKPNKLLGAPVTAWHAYERVLEAGEMGSRMATFDDVLKNTGDITEATYQANDVMNFSRRGDSTLYNFFADAVPFMNAKVQGMDKMVRAGKATPAAFLLKSMMLTAGTLALLAINKDDERYWALNESVRDSYWVLPTAQGFIQIPKPFELGSFFGTIPERAYEAATRDDKVFWDRMAQMFLTTFSMNPIPQAVSPIVEDVANKDFFTQFPIVTEGMKFKDAPDQYNAYTAEFVKDLSKSLPDSFPDALRSPVRLQHLMEGYTGSMGQYVMSGADVAYRTVFDRPELPATPEGNYPILNTFFKAGERSDKYQARVYEMQQQVREANAKLKTYREARDFEGVRKTMKEKGTELQARKNIERAAKQLTDLSGDSKKVMADKSLTAEQKRQKMDEITQKKNSIAKEINDRWWSKLRDAK